MSGAFARIRCRSFQNMAKPFKARVRAGGKAEL